MSTQEKPDNDLDQEVKGSGLSRREFLRNAGFVIGGASLGSMAFLAACSGGTSTQTVTQTVGAGSTVTVTATTTATGTGTGTAAPTGLVHLIINGVDYWGVVEPQWTLAYVIREKLGLIGTKRGCDSGDCGVCTVIMDGRPVESCITLAIEADGKPITTIEGLNTGDKLDPLQQAWVDNDALQCGFCTAGFMMNAKALLAFKSNPTDAEIKEFLAGTICRCGAYINIIKAVKSLAK